MVSIAKYSDIHKMDDPFCVPGSVCVLLKLVHLLNTERSDKALPQGRVWVGVGRDSDKELGRSYLNSSTYKIRSGATKPSHRGGFGWGSEGIPIKSWGGVT